MKKPKFSTVLAAFLLALSVVSCDTVTDLLDGNNLGNGGATTTFTVSFNANGGSGTAPNAQTVNAGSSVTLPPQGSLAKSGLTFGGRNTKADGTGINFAAGNSMIPSGDVTMYAQWDSAIIPITSVQIVVTAPVMGATADTIAYGTGNFAIGKVSWSPVANNLFLADTVYTATVTLTASSGYSFTGLNSATINGKNASLSNNIGSVVTLSYTFPSTEAAVAPPLALRAKPVAASTSTPKVLDSYTDGTKNYYLIDVGHIENTYISDVVLPVDYNGVTSVSFSKTTVTASTIAEAMKETISSSITVSDT